VRHGLAHGKDEIGTAKGKPRGEAKPEGDGIGVVRKEDPPVLGDHDRLAVHSSEDDCGNPGNNEMRVDQVRLERELAPGDLRRGEVPCNPCRRPGIGHSNEREAVVVGGDGPKTSTPVAVEVRDDNISMICGCPGIFADEDSSDRLIGRRVRRREDEDLQSFLALMPS
jgi:hypothetical protein